MDTEIPIFTVDDVLKSANDSKVEAELASALKEARQISQTTRPQQITLSHATSSSLVLRKCLDMGMVQIPDPSRVIVSWIGGKPDKMDKCIQELCNQFKVVRDPELQTLTSKIYRGLFEHVSGCIANKLPSVNVDLKFDSELRGSEPLSSQERQNVANSLTNLLTKGGFSVSFDSAKERLVIIPPITPFTVEDIVSQTKQQQQQKHHALPMSRGNNDETASLLAKLSQKRHKTEESMVIVNSFIDGLSLVSERLLELKTFKHKVMPEQAQAMIDEIDSHKAHLESLRQFVIHHLSIALTLQKTAGIDVEIPTMTHSSNNNSREWFNSPPSSPKPQQRTARGGFGIWN